MSTQRTVWVVGGAGGIGRALCDRLAQTGYRVVVIDRNGATAERVAEGLADASHGHAEMDVTSEAQVDAVFDRLEVDSPAAVLIVVAGGSLGGEPLDAMRLQTWSDTLSLNLTGIFLCVRKFARLRKRTPLAHMRIVNFGSIAGQIGTSPSGVAYAAAKAGIFGFTRHAAIELAKAGITVNAVAPGAVGTDAFNDFVDPAYKASVSARVPLGRVADPVEIAGAVAFLVSEQASYITGATLDVNGGMLMR